MTEVWEHNKGPEPPEDSAEPPSGDDSLSTNPSTGGANPATPSAMSGSSGSLPSAGASEPISIPDPGELKHGQVVIDERYEVVEKLGSGGMGVVWLIKHKFTEELHALKLLKNEGGEANSAAWKRFRREAKLLGRFQHPNAVRVIDAKISGDRAYIIMEFVPGESLDKILKGRNKRPFSAEWVASFTSQMCKVLQVAHESKIVHRDLKPSNIMLSAGPSPERPHIRLLDLGIAKDLRQDEADLTADGSFLGTPMYASPEQARGAATLDRRSDVYSLGVILFELLTGDRPFKGAHGKLVYDHQFAKPPRFDEVRRGLMLPAGLEDLVRRCLEKEPERRPQTAKELEDDLSALMSRAETEGSMTAQEVPIYDLPPVELATPDSVLVTSQPTRDLIRPGTAEGESDILGVGTGGSEIPIEATGASSRPEAVGTAGDVDYESLTNSTMGLVFEPSADSMSAMSTGADSHQSDASLQLKSPGSGGSYTLTSVEPGIIAEPSGESIPDVTIESGRAKYGTWGWIAAAAAGVLIVVGGGGYGAWQRYAGHEPIVPPKQDAGDELNAGWKPPVEPEVLKQPKFTEAELTRRRALQLEGYFTDQDAKSEGDGWPDRIFYEQVDGFRTATGSEHSIRSRTPLVLVQGFYLPPDFQIEDLGATEEYWPRRIFHEIQDEDETHRIYFVRVRSENDGYTMGDFRALAVQIDENNDALPTRKVRLSGFYIQEDEVTIAEARWALEKLERPKGHWPGAFVDLIGNLVDETSLTASRYPATWLNRWEASEMAYVLGGMLPSEAQWEYVARSLGKEWEFGRAGVTEKEVGRWPGINDLDRRDRPTNPIVAVDEGYEDRTQQGVLRMAGNAREWCRDVYRSGYVDSSEENLDPEFVPEGKLERGERFVVRGASGLDPASKARTFVRGSLKGDRADESLGFRVVIETPSIGPALEAAAARASAREGSDPR